MANFKRRKAELLVTYERVKKVIKNDPAITPGQLCTRFGLGYMKLAQLRKEVEDNANKTK